MAMNDCLSSDCRLVTMTQLSLLALAVIVSNVFVCHSHGYMWQGQEQLIAYVNKYFTKVNQIPPRKETAAMITKYFLKRDVTVGQHPKDRVLRRANPTVDYAHFYDTIFLVDSSSSLNLRNFKRAIRALQRLVDRGLPNTFYAAITFANTAKLEFKFVGKKLAKKSLHKIERRRGRTNTQAALRMAFDLIRNNRSNIRYGSVRRILIVTDGLSNVKPYLTLYQGFRLKASGVQIYVIAIGRYRHGFQEILGLASSAHEHLYRVGHMRGFQKLVNLIPVWPLNAVEERTWRKSVRNRRFLYKKSRRKMF